MATVHTWLLALLPMAMLGVVVALGLSWARRARAANGGTSGRRLGAWHLLMVAAAMMLAGAVLTAGIDQRLPHWTGAFSATQDARSRYAEVQLLWAVVFLGLHGLLLANGNRDPLRWRWLVAHATATLGPLILVLVLESSESRWVTVMIFGCAQAIHVGALLVAARLALECPAPDDPARIARELHDGAASRLVALLLRMDPQDPTLQPLRSELEDCLLELQMAVDVLHSGQRLQTFVLSDGLARLRYRVQPALDRLGIVLHWDVDTRPTGLRAAHAVDLCRIAQEALSNTMRHAGARQVRLRWGPVLEDSGGMGGWELDIQDDGCGLPAAAPEAHAGFPAGRGLSNMRARASAMHARLTLVPAHPQGLRVNVRLGAPQGIGVSQLAGGGRGIRPAAP